MIRSLYSGVSGLTNHQTKMDVIGNNIANVNTFGFKASKAIFKDIFYQSVNTPSAGSAAFAGNNPATVGYGVQIADIVKDMSGSNLQATNRKLDMAIYGDGFFMTATFPFGTTDPANPTADPEDGYEAGDPDYVYTPTSAVSYTRLGNMGVDSYGNLVADSNVFLLGTRNSALGLSQTYDDSSQTLLEEELVDTNGDGRVNGGDLTYKNTINVNKLIQEAYNIHTDVNGFLFTYTTVTANADGSVTYEDPAYCDESGNVIADAEDYSGDEMDADEIADVIESGAVQGEFTFQDLGSFSIDKYGVITTSFNNEMKAIARIELAVFDNPDGLVEAGNTSYAETAASGTANVKKPKSEGAGEVRSSMLEMSNVNLANEFSDMIVTQRGFQANSRIITVSDSMLEELVNLKR